MTGCNLLDFGKPARQNGKRLPCERLMAENAKLRELVSGLEYCARTSVCDCCCPLYDPSGTNHRRCESLERELGVEVEP